MSYAVLDENGRQLDAHLDLDTSAIILHSRGGSRGQRGVRNQEYGPALRLLLERILAAGVQIDRVWVDSSRVQALPIASRTILNAEDMRRGAQDAFRLMSSRMKDVGRLEGTGGNTTKRIRIQFAGPRPVAELEHLLRVSRIERDFRSAERLPAEQLNQVTAEHIWNAVQSLLAARPAPHPFGPSTDFDLITSAGDRLPPKAVFGLAASEALGFDVQPKHFSGGLGTACFRILERAGYIIVPKGADTPPSADVPIANEDREWAEGMPKLINHLKRERATGLAQAKKDNFRRQNGLLRCERCGLDPVQVYGGPHGEACIEIHHNAIHVEHMGEAHRTRLEDLQCLCANCHRVVHRLIRARSKSVAPSHVT